MREVEIKPGECTDKMSAIYRRVEERQASCKAARDKITSKSAGARLRQVMLAGKTKAYVDVLCLIKDKYPEHLQEDLQEQQP